MVSGNNPFQQAIPERNGRSMRSAPAISPILELPPTFEPGGEAVQRTPAPDSRRELASARSASDLHTRRSPRASQASMGFGLASRPAAERRTKTAPGNRRSNQRRFRIMEEEWPPLGLRVICTLGALHVPLRHRWDSDLLLVQQPNGGESCRHMRLRSFTVHQG